MIKSKLEIKYLINYSSYGLIFYLGKKNEIRI